MEVGNPVTVFFEKVSNRDGLEDLFFQVDQIDFLYLDSNILENGTYSFVYSTLIQVGIRN